MPSIEKKVIERVYFITHPAFALLEPEEEKPYSRRDLEIYFENHLRRVIHDAQHDPNSLLVFVPSIHLGKKVMSTIKSSLPAFELEKKWMAYAKRQLKGRLFVPKILTPYARSDVVADHLRRSMAAKGFDVKKANIIGYGTWLEACAAAYPKQFLIRIMGAKKFAQTIDAKRPQKAIDAYWWRRNNQLKIIETGSISIGPKIGFKPLPAKKSMKPKRIVKP